MFLAEYEDKVDPDTILLPGVSGGHNLNTLEEFELDYSQVGRSRRRRRRLFELSSQSHQALSLRPEKESSSESIVECGITLFNSLDVQKNPRQHSKLALVAKTLGTTFNKILLFSS